VRRPPKAHVATGPNQVWSWDITYLKSPVRGVFFYLYLVMDVWSRKIVGWAVHDLESAHHAAALFQNICVSMALNPRGIVLHADNGGPMTKRNANASINTPLRGQKGDIFEGGIRVPFLVSWPARLPAGRVYEHPVISLDVFPTALAAARATRDPARPPLDGTDLAPFLSGKQTTAPHERLFWRMDGGAAFAVREGGWKWFRTYENAPQLYDLSADPGESRDLAAQQPAIAARLAAASAEWNRTLVPPTWVNNPFGGLINLPGPAPAATP
jgi:hypothetical protein